MSPKPSAAARDLDAMGGMVRKVAERGDCKLSGAARRMGVDAHMAGLLRSRKFWIMIVDVAASTIIFFLAKYSSESMVEDVKFLIASYQPVILLVIGAIAYEDGAGIKAKSVTDAAYTATLAPPVATVAPQSVTVNVPGAVITSDAGRG